MSQDDPKIIDSTKLKISMEYWRKKGNKTFPITPGIFVSAHGNIAIYMFGLGSLVTSELYAFSLLRIKLYARDAHQYTHNESTVTLSLQVHGNPIEFVVNNSEHC